MQDHGGSVREDEAQSNGETRSFPPAFVDGFCPVVPRPLSLRAGGWRSPWAPPTPDRLSLWYLPSLVVLQGGEGGQGTQPLAQGGFAW